MNNSLPASFRYRRDEIVRIARTVHAAVSAIAEVFKLGDGLPWEVIGEHDRAMVIDMVKCVIDTDTRDASDLHAIWVRAMTKQGWRHGKKLDQAKQTHPHMGDFADIPQQVQAQYCAARRIVQEMME